VCTCVVPATMVNAVTITGVFCIKFETSLCYKRKHLNSAIETTCQHVPYRRRLHGGLYRHHCVFARCSYSIHAHICARRRTTKKQPRATIVTFTLVLGKSRSGFDKSNPRRQNPGFQNPIPVGSNGFMDLQLYTACPHHFTHIVRRAGGS
jgi:hypothetical protein